jgi:peptidoglycan hydrolase-like protein with peptidoglycan-binding domain
MAIAPGDAGEAVRQLQHRLGAAGYLPDAGVTPDLYCSGTQQGVRAFQEDRGLTAPPTCEVTMSLNFNVCYRDWALIAVELTASLDKNSIRRCVIFS